MMKIELIYQSNDTGEIYNISDLAKLITTETYLEKNPGKLSLTFFPGKDMIIPKGSIIYLKVDGVGMFYGYVFTMTRTEKSEVGLIAFNQLRYLKNNDTYVFVDSTASDIFTQICTDFQLTYSVDTESSYVLASKIHDNKTLYTMIQDGLDRTLANNEEWFFIYDDFGTLRFVNLNELKTTLIIKEGYNLLSFSYKSTIDSTTYNKVKLVRENEETAKRDVYVVQDSSNIASWGILQYFDTVDEGVNEAQIEELGTSLLNLYNKESKTAIVTAIGDTEIQAGSGIILDIKELDNYSESTLQYYLVERCSHTFTNNEHKMKLEVRVN